SLACRRIIPWSCYNIPMPRMVKCAKLGRELPGLDEPPFDTELGQKIFLIKPGQKINLMEYML
ncbi:MAG TPA: Fe(2+)-trafficking protein, partial [Candidatus Limnocylindrales bacterium]|nr:Fe(2+)-trafficking protein [Candidatus Limnocylindrales bacterium]